MWQAELVGREILGQGHVGPAARGRFEVPGEFLPHVGAADAFVVHPVGHAVDCDLHFGDVGVEVVFSVPGARRVGVDEQEQDALERPALWVHPQIQPGVRSSCNGNHPLTHDKVVRELLAAAVSAECLISQGLAPNDLVLQLDVFQLVHELGCVRASHHLHCRGEGQFENQVVGEGLRVKDSVVRQNRVVQVDAILGPVDTVQLVFLIHAA